MQAAHSLDVSTLRLFLSFVKNGAMASKEELSGDGGGKTYMTGTNWLLKLVRQRLPAPFVG
jgi:hypothetical protein